MTSPDVYDEHYFRAIRGGDALNRHFLSLLSGLRPSELSVVDVGCGRGDLLLLLAQAGFRSVAGLDFSSAAVVHARQKLAELENGGAPLANVVEGSIADRDVLPPESFDVALMMDVVEHLPSELLRTGLANVRAWLKPGGRLFVHTFPTLGPHKLYRMFLKARGRRAELTALDTIHCNVQTRKSLKRSLEEAELHVDQIWLRNDVARTSSVYHRLPDGFGKRALGFVANDVVGNPTLGRALSWVGLAEFAAPSIYVCCRRPV